MQVRRILFGNLLWLIALHAAAQEGAGVRSFQLKDVELRTALDSLLEWYGVPVVYLDSQVAAKRVDAKCHDCTFEAALKSIVVGHNMHWTFVGGQVIVRQREVPSEPLLSTISGMLNDSLTGDPIAGANVLLLAVGDTSIVHRWCPTNAFGFFSLRNVHAGSYALAVHRVGYRAVREPVAVSPGSAAMRQLSMVAQEFVQPEMTIEGRRSAFPTSQGISTGVYVRATPSDYNQYLLEGARIYNPVQFGGVMTTFNTDALHDVQMVAGGVPPYYGGRIGGILDVALRNGIGTSLHGSATLGTLASNLVLDGPLAHSTTFVLSGRHSYRDMLLSREASNRPPSDLRATEIMGKVSRQLSGNQRISLTGYVQLDGYEKNIDGTFGAQLGNSLHWNNAAANLRWNAVVSPSLFVHTSAIYTRYGFTVDQRLNRSASGNDQYRSTYAIEDVVLRAHGEYFYDEFHTMLAGVELARHRMVGTISAFSSQIAPMTFDGVGPWELAVYVQDQWRLVPSVLAELGARATSFVARQGSFSAIDPRFSLLISLTDETRLFSSLSAVSQFVHPYRNSGIFLFYPSILFYPSSDRVPPSTSLQVSLGMERWYHEHRYRLAVETYYRTTQKSHEFVFDTAMAGSIMDALIIGEGHSYGAEVTLDRRFGAVSGSLRYSLSWASNRFDALNNGEPFRPRFDRRHEIAASMSYTVHEQWSVGATCVLSTNEFPSFRSRGENALSPAYSGDDRGGGPIVADAERTPYAEPYDLNGDRLPGFQRLELRLTHRFASWGMPMEATLRLLNGYGLIDPFLWELRSNPDPRRQWRVTFDAPPLVPVYPVASVSARL
jgi:hypothetical protein